MSGRFLLDTNIVIALFNNDTNVVAGLSTASDVFTASIVIGELYYGARNSGRVAENIARVSAFAASNVVLECDVQTAEYYGQVKSKLRAKGRPLPEMIFGLQRLHSSMTSRSRPGMRILMTSTISKP